METHDAGRCEDCVIQEVAMNGHEMKLIIPCAERKAYWACLTCDQIDKWPVVEDIQAINEIMKAMMYIHCVDEIKLAPA
jgi:hypothetical protein